MLGDVGQEGDRLVMHLALDLANALDLEFAALAHRLRGPGRDDSELFLRLAGIGLDVELNAEIVLRLPDRCHLRPAIAWDHAETSSAEISLFGAQDAAAAESTMKDSAITTSSWYSPCYFVACRSMPYSTKPRLAESRRTGRLSAMTKHCRS